MANRSTLAANKLDEFKEWLSTNGWIVEKPKGIYEALRARRPDRSKPLIIWKRASNRSGTDLSHLTVEDNDIAVVSEFLKDRAEKHGGSGKEQFEGVHYQIRGDYVFTGVRNAFNSKRSFWISKKGCIQSMYCFTADTDDEVDYQLRYAFGEYIDIYEKMLEKLRWNK